MNLKFRLWDTSFKKMIYDELTSGYKMGMMLNGTVIGFDEFNEYDPHSEANIGIYPERFIPMQFTGIKDKNNVEIYESDILKSLHTGFNFKVCFDGNWCGISVEDLNIKIYNLYRSNMNCYEIIGNVFEEQ